MQGRGTNPCTPEPIEPVDERSEEHSETERCLSGWAPELEEFQTKTYQLLLQAQEVEQAARHAAHDDLHIPSPTVTAMPVRCCVDDGPGLTADMAALVEDPSAIQPPTVEKFHTAALGNGIKTTRHCLYDAEPGQDPDQRGVWVSVRYAFKVPDRQAVVTVVATHDDLGRMTAAQPDLDEFVNTISLTYADGRPFTPDPAP